MRSVVRIGSLVADSNHGGNALPDRTEFQGLPASWHAEGHQPSIAGSASAAVGPGSNAPSPYMPTASSPTTQSIIMSDGNICDPIRHMGC